MVAQSVSDSIDGHDRVQVSYESLGLKLECVINTPSEKIHENIKTNIRRGHPQVWPCNPMKRVNGELVKNDVVLGIVAGGPSLADSIEDIRELQVSGGKIVALANTARFLVDNGIRPNAHVLLDAKPRNAEFVVPCVKTTYFIASQCDPSVFDEAEKTGNDIYIWHAVNNDSDFQEITDHYEMWVPVQSGATIALRALRLFSILGYSRFEMFGFDSCKIDGKHHAYEQPDADSQPSFKLSVNDRVFDVSPWMINQFMEFMEIIRREGAEWEMKVHGDGLIAYLVKEGAKIALEE